MQFAILAQSPPEMALTESILPRYFLSRVRVSIRPRFFYTPKKTKPARGPVACFSATDRQNGAIRNAVYTFTPGGDLRPRRLWMILLAPQNQPSLRKSYPRCNDPAKRGSVCEAFEKKPLPLALNTPLTLQVPTRPTGQKL